MSVVVGYDRPRASRTALLCAQELAGALNVHLHVVHGVDLADSPLDGDAQSWRETTGRHRQAEHQHVKAALEAADVQWTYHTMRGGPVTALIGVAPSLIRRSGRPDVVVSESTDGPR